MSREIKFRGISKEGGKFVYGLPKVVKNTSGEVIAAYIQYFTKHYMLVEEAIIIETLGQYTGLKDKNNAEIYESDIVKETVLKVANSRGDGIGKYTIKEVKFNAYFGFSSIGRIDRVNRGICEIEVIGNIYENPELVEVE